MSASAEFTLAELPVTTWSRETIGAAEAADLLTLAALLNKNKSLSEAQIRRLAYKAEHGFWVDDGAIHLGAVFQGYGSDGPVWDWRLASGRHRLIMITRTGQLLPFVVIRKYFRTEADFIRWMMTFVDHGARQHSARASLIAVAGEASGLRRKDDIEAVGQAYALLKSGFRRVEAGSPVEEREEFVLAWAGEAREYEKLIAGCSTTVRPRMMAQGILSVGLVVLRYQSEKAHTFIRGAALNEASLDQSAIAAMHARIIRGDSVVWPGDERRRKANRSERQPTTPSPEVAAFTAECWNAFFQNRPLRYPRVPKLIVGTEGGRASLPPIKLAGTPFDGNVWLPYSALMARE